MEAIEKVIKKAVGTILSRVAAPIGAWRFHRAEQTRLVVGAGPTRIAGWTNTDINWRASYYLDVGKDWPVMPASVEFVYSDNMVEHLPFDVAQRFFRHAFTGLRPGGVFRIVTPDVQAVARQYLEQGSFAEAGLARHREKGRAGRYPVELIAAVFVSDEHWKGYCWDFDSLKTELEFVGFTVERLRINESNHSELRNLEQRIDPTEAGTSLVVEAMKPRKGLTEIVSE